MKLFQPHCTLDYIRLCQLIYVGGDAASFFWDKMY